MRSAMSFSKVADIYSRVPTERDVEQAIVALKKGGKLLLYGSKPKFGHFRLTPDEEELIYSVDNKEKNLKICVISKVIFGQKEGIFVKHRVPEKEDQSLSLVYNNEESSLDLICKDAEEAEIWYIGIRALITQNRRKLEFKGERRASLDPTSSCPSPVYSITASNKEGYQHRSGKRFSLPAKYSDGVQLVDRAGRSNPSKTSEQDLSGFPSHDESESATSDFGGESITDSASNDKPHPGANILPSTIEIWSNPGDSNAWNQDANHHLLSPTAISGPLHSLDASEAVRSLDSSVYSGTAMQPDNANAISDSHPDSWQYENTEMTLDTWNKHGVHNSDSWSHSDSQSLQANQRFDVSDVNLRGSLSSALSTSSLGSGIEESDFMGDVFLWGEGTGEGILGGGENLPRSENFNSDKKNDSLLPRILDSGIVLDAKFIACGSSHMVLITRRGELFSWGEEKKGRLGSGTNRDFPTPQIVDTFHSHYILNASCGEFHTCAVSRTGDLFSWGDNSRVKHLLGHGDDVFNNWIPKKVKCSENIRVVSVACGIYHTALISSTGQLFTFGEGMYGALGFGDRKSVSIPREVVRLQGLKTLKVSCGVFHTAAVIDVLNSSDYSLSRHMAGKLFTWGDGEKGQLGLDRKKTVLEPTMVSTLVDEYVVQVACGQSMTVALSSKGQVYTMGSNVYGQLGSPDSDGSVPCKVEGSLAQKSVDQIACGLNHVVVLASDGVYSWGRGLNGRLGLGDLRDRITPTLIDALNDKSVLMVSCGHTISAAICQHKPFLNTDHNACTQCKQEFAYMKRKHNCYNCGHTFCHSCSSRKVYGAAMAPSSSQPYRVCDSCFSKLTKMSSSDLIANKSSLSLNVNPKKKIWSRNPVNQGSSSISKMSSPINPTNLNEPYRKSKSNLSLDWTCIRPTSLFQQTFELFSLEKQDTIPSPSSTIPMLSPISSTKLNPKGLLPKRSSSPLRKLSPLRRSISPMKLNTSNGANNASNNGMSPQELEILTLRKSNETMGHEVNRLRIQVDSLKQKCDELEQASLVSRAWADRQVESVSKMASEEMSKARETILELNCTLQDVSKKYNIDLEEILSHTASNPPSVLDLINPLTIAPHPAKNAVKANASRPSTPRQSSPIRSASPSKLLERFTFPSFLVSKDKKQSANPTALSANRSVSDGHYAHDRMTKSAGYAETLKFKSEGTKRTIIAQKSMQIPSKSAEFTSTTKTSVIKEMNVPDDPYTEFHDSHQAENGGERDSNSEYEGDALYGNARSPERVPRVVAKFVTSTHAVSIKEESPLRVHPESSENKVLQSMQSEKDIREKELRHARVLVSNPKGAATEPSERKLVNSERLEDNDKKLSEMNQASGEEPIARKALRGEEKSSLLERRKTTAVSVFAERRMQDKVSRVFQDENSDEEENEEQDPESNGGGKGSLAYNSYGAERDEKSRGTEKVDNTENESGKDSHDSDGKAVKVKRNDGSKDFEKDRREETEKSDAPKDEVVYPEDGVYITIRPNINGGNELRRVRFSRKLFKEKQAEEWWSENKALVYKKYSIITFDRKSHSSSSVAKLKTDKSETDSSSVVSSSMMTSIAVNPLSPTSATTKSTANTPHSPNSDSASAPPSDSKTPYVVKALRGTKATTESAPSQTAASIRSLRDSKSNPSSASKFTGYSTSGGKPHVHATPVASNNNKNPRWM